MCDVAVYADCPDDLASFAVVQLRLQARKEMEDRQHERSSSWHDQYISSTERIDSSAAELKKMEVLVLLLESANPYIQTQYSNMQAVISGKVDSRSSSRPHQNNGSPISCRSLC